MSTYLFVGERQSPTAAARGWTWESGRLAARTLHEALQAAGIEPAQQRYCNLWATPGLGTPAEAADLSTALAGCSEGLRLVALGALVAKELERAGIPHIAMRHPAARGRGRLRSLYRSHVRDVLTRLAEVPA